MLFFYLLLGMHSIKDSALGFCCLTLDLKKKIENLRLLSFNQDVAFMRSYTFKILLCFLFCFKIYLSVTGWRRF